MVLRPGFPHTYVVIRKLETFRHRCVMYIMGMRKSIKWAQYITSIQLAERFVVDESIGNLFSLARLRWLGHVACMADNRTPKGILSG